MKRCFYPLLNVYSFVMLDLIRGAARPSGADGQGTGRGPKTNGITNPVA